MTFLTAGADLLTDLFDGFVGVCEKIVTLITSLFQSIVDMFWVSGTGLTSFGKLMIIPIAFGLFWGVYRIIKGLIKPKM